MTACATCGSDPCPNPQFCAQCRKADAERARQAESAHDLRNLLSLPDDVSFQAIWGEMNTIKGGAAASTIEALMFALRRGGSALSEDSNLRRLSELSETQLHEVCGRLQKFQPHIARTCAPAEVEALVETWGELKRGR